jgi:hypothetical protein
LLLPILGTEQVGAVVENDTLQTQGVLLIELFPILTVLAP